MLVGTATAFAVTQHLKLEPSPISQTHVAKVFSPVCECETDAAKIEFTLRRAQALEQARHPQTAQPNWAIGCLEWQAEQEKAKLSGRI